MTMHDISWHLHYFEHSYLFYTTFASLVVIIFGAIYCCKVPAKRFPDLLDILDNDPVINEFHLTLTSYRNGSRRPAVGSAQTKVPERAWASTRMKEEKAMPKKAASKPSGLRRRRKKSNTSSGQPTRSKAKLPPPSPVSVSSSKKASFDMSEQEKQHQEDAYDSIVSVDEGCSLIQKPEAGSSLKGSITSMVKSVSKQSLKKFAFARDEDKIDTV